jgi:arsenate reductase
MTTLYGIKNCDTMKKAMKWLDAHHVDYTFHDVRKDGLTKKTLTDWCKQVGWETLLNTRGTTWRKLPEEVRDTVNKTKAIGIMFEQPAIIKRPVLVKGKQIHVGFKPDLYAEIFS